MMSESINGMELLRNSIAMVKVKRGRLATRCATLKGLAVSDIEPDQITKLLRQVEANDDDYVQAHEDLLAEDEELSDDKFIPELQHHNKISRELRTLLNKMLNQAKAHELISCIENSLEDMDADLVADGYSKILDAPMQHLEKYLQELHAASSKVGVRGCKTLDDRILALKRASKKLQQAKAAFEDAKGDSKPVVPVLSIPAVPHTQGLTLEVPKFSGAPLDWKPWWDTFSTVMSEHSYLTPHSQKCHFLKSMEGEECKTYVERVFEEESDYASAVAIIRKRYEDPRMLHMHHHKTFECAPVNDDKRRSMQEQLARHKKYMKALAEYNVTTPGQVAVMYDVMHMTPSLLSKWKKSTRKHKDTPTSKVMVEFLEEQIEAAGTEEIESFDGKPPQHTSAKSRFSKRTPSSNVFQAREGGTSCALCKGSHYLCFCPKYKEKSVTQRTDYVRTSKLCWNCLSKSHRLSACTSEHRCKTCGELHHTTLHKTKETHHPPVKEVSSPPVKDAAGKTNKPASTDASVLTLNNQGAKVPPRLSATAIVTVRANGLDQKARAQFDSGSSISLISKKLAQTLHAKPIPNSRVQLRGVNGSSSSPYKVGITLVGRKGEQVHVEPHVQETLIGTHTRLNLSELRSHAFLHGLSLADPEYQSMSRIDLLLDIETTNACLLMESRSGPTPGMRATNSIFGWVIGGGITTERVEDQEEVCCRIQLDEDDPVQIFRDLVALETDGGSALSEDEEAAIKHFSEHVRRDEEGRYYVSLPRRIPTPELGHSRAAALRRYISNEKSLRRRGQWEAFATAVEDYYKLGHAEVVPAEEENVKPAQETYYLPMHGVSKETSTTTKLRVVFDASASTSTGISLNDTLLPGPSLHPLLTTVLTIFRRYQYAVTADIGKMFRGIGLNPEEYDLHRFFHYGADGALLEVLRMKRLTFGIKSSPFLANQVLRKVSEDYADEYPLAAELVASHFYVDDCLAGADTVEEALEKITQAINLVKEACLELRKIRSNSPELLARLPEHLRETADLVIPTSPSSCSKALGLHWGVREDALYVSVPPTPENQVATRRRVASMVARIFDLLGFFSPAILPGRMILQESWSEPGGWDAPLSENLQTQWREWSAHLFNLAKHPIPRYLGIHGKTKQTIQLHGFADASFKAFGAVIYLRSFYTDATIGIDFVTSKSRVVPKPKATIPRLELCSAVILSQLMEKVMGELEVPSDACFYWSDSTVVLGWLKRDAGGLKTFVSNRVRKIQNSSDVRHWRHVDGVLNPADLLSRGVPSQELIQSERWWKGPPWLTLSCSEWPCTSQKDTASDATEEKVTALYVAPEVEYGSEVCSTFNDLVRSTIYMRRFLHPEKTHPRHITVHEYITERRWLFSKSQKYSYPKEYELLSQKKLLPKGSPLASLAPYIDKHGVIRVGGRLQRAGLKPSETHPVILSVKSATVQMFLKKTHQDKHHAGATTIMATLAFQYHIPTLKRYLRKLSRSCIQCRMQYARTARQQMGSLPECRTRIARPFSITGMDFAGPFKIRRGRIRDPVKLKAYVCVFVCYVTHATHLELVSDLTTEAFLAALSRFVAKRGCPERLESDNGSNFVGASTKLKRLTKHLRKPEGRRRMEEWCIQKSVDWKFTPPRSPHFGGLWEAAVGAMKRVLVKALKKQRLDFEEFSTILGEVEAILNSRPLIPIDAPAEDAVEPLTPGHFLVGAPLTALPFQAEEHQQLTLLRRWNLVQRLQHDLWERWKTEYLSRLHKRQKNQRPVRSFEVGDVVIERNADTFQRVWPLAVVTKVKPGPDGLVRVVDIRRSNHRDTSKVVTRGIENLVHLFSEAEVLSSEGGECLGQEEIGSKRLMEDGCFEHEKPGRESEMEYARGCQSEATEECTSTNKKEQEYAGPRAAHVNKLLPGERTPI